MGVVDRPKMLDPESVREGDVLIGLASSGLHSNGYSLARKVCVEGKSTEELLAPVDTLDGQVGGRGAAHSDAHLREAGALRARRVPQGCACACAPSRAAVSPRTSTAR